MYRPDFEIRGRVAAALIPACCAGPIFLFGYVSASALVAPNRATGPVVALIGLFSVPFGFIFALLPMIGGVMMMSRLGAMSQAMRNPFAWAMAGFAMSAGLVAIFGSFDPVLGSALLLTGTACASLGRAFVRWTSDFDVGDVFS